MWPADILQAQAGHGHPGLFWRYGGKVGTTAPGADKEAWREAHVDAACSFAKTCVAVGNRHGDAYRRAFNRRTTWLESTAGHGNEVVSVPLEGRLKTGGGEPTVFECQLALHPVTGMPRLLASGLHGLLAAWAFARHQHLPALSGAGTLALERQHLVALLGHRPGEPDEQAAALVIHDAWWDPLLSTRGPLEKERATNHHPDYYQGQLRSVIDDGHASDFDNPIPTPLIATAGCFQLAISHAHIGAAWAQQCMHWLRLALAESGAGASRQTGYGRFRAPAPGPHTQSEGK